MHNEKLLEILKSNSDESYTSFSTVLSNTSLKIIGVKIPKLKELAKIYMEICDFEEKEIFLLGGKEMYFYLKDTGVIKEK